MELTIKPYRKGFAIFAGVARLASGFKTLQAAERELAEDRAMLEYWAGSAGAVSQNKPARVVQL